MNAAIWKTSMAAAALTVLLWTAVARGGETVSPRGFCQAGGGAVMETGDPDVHICCYTARRQCLAVNSHSRLSMRVGFPDDVSDAAPEARADLSVSAGTGSTNSAPR